MAHPRVLHVKRDWNQSADRLASEALHQQRGVDSVPRKEWPGLEAINRLPELLVPKDQEQTARVCAVTRSIPLIREYEEMMQADVLQQLRVERIRKAQEEESWIANLKAYLRGDLGGLSAESAQSCSKLARDYETSDEGLLVYCPSHKNDEDDRELTARLVIPEALQTDILHHYHASLEGGH